MSSTDKSEVEENAGFEIRHKRTGDVLHRVAEPTLRGADLSGLALYSANLEGADLREADLRGTSLLGAVLVGARLDGAKLHRATLYAADLSCAWRATRSPAPGTAGRRSSTSAPILRPR